jgi:hypothetical protein
MENSALIWVFGLYENGEFSEVSPIICFDVIIFLFEISAVV